MAKKITEPKDYWDKDAEDHPDFGKFCDWAAENGVDIESKPDWLEWWKCFFAGIIVGMSN